MRRQTVRALALGLALAVGARAAPASYLAVFVDGRILKVAAARLLDERRIRLELPGGGTLDVPLTRLDRVIEDEIESAPEPVKEPPCPAAFVDQPLPGGTPFAAEIRRASRKENLHPWLVAAVIEAESGFNPWAVSRVGARGLMQLMPAVWVEQRVSNPHDPRANLRAGCRHLRALLDRFGDVALALAAYNAGAAVVERSGGMPPYRETREYVRQVLAKLCPAG